MMKMTMTAGVLATTATVLAGHVDFDLQDKLGGMNETDPVSVLVYLDQVDLEGLNTALLQEGASRQVRHQEVVMALQSMADMTQPEVLAELDGLAATGDVRSFESYWISNCIRVDTTAGQVDALAAIPGVNTIYYNYPVELITPSTFDLSNSDIFNPLGVVEPGIVAINADDCWAAGYDGTGVLVANLDTGVQGDHEALESRWAGNRPEYAGHPEWAWLDYDSGSATPWDHHWHGTHTMGTICGGAPGDSVGVAPGAHWIAGGGLDAGSIGDTVAGNIQVFQWMLDPDGDPSTVWDVPAVVGNSWGLVSAHGYPDCDDTFWTHIDALHAGGTVMIFAAGNEGSGANTLRRPADRAMGEFENHAVAAVDANTAGWPVAGFSSRGPTYCTSDGSAAIKPDISAPGVDVRSAWSDGDYGNSGGTSMATPHVTGVVALMLQACPDLTPEEVHTIIFDTAFDLGPAGEDNDYGYGMIDAWAAVQAALALCGGGGGDPIDCACNAQFSVGDRVQATVDSPQGATGIVAGMCGTVICGNVTSGPLNIMVEWDDWYNGHDNFPACECGSDSTSGTSSCWFVDCTDIELGCATDSSCEDGFECGESLEDFLCGDSCYCFETVSGNDHCAYVADPSQPCADYQVCAADDECPPDNVCIISCCADPVCLPLCDAAPVTGACCILDVCSVTTEADCEDSGGVYQGDDSICEADTCSCDDDLGDCPADLNGDGTVNVSDLLALLDGWGGTGPPRPAGDINGDCEVNVADLLALLDAWGPCPGGGSVDCVCDAQYNVGDRVQALVDNPSGASGLMAGHCGTVICGSFGNPPFMIEWDNWYEGHDNTAACDCGGDESSGTESCWYVQCDEIAAGCDGGTSSCEYGWDCEGGDPIPWCNEAESCFCGTEWGTGDLYCVSDESCSSMDVCPTGDCPAGFVCVVDSCCVDPVCTPLCDDTPGPTPPAGALKGSGRITSSSGTISTPPVPSGR